MLKQLRCTMMPLRVVKVCFERVYSIAQQLRLRCIHPRLGWYRGVSGKGLCDFRNALVPTAKQPKDHLQYGHVITCIEIGVGGLTAFGRGPYTR